MEDLSNWAIGNGFVTLYDLSTWDRKGKWIGWKLLQPLNHLKQVVDILLPLLHGMAPISKNSKDSIGWGRNGTYIVKEGYQLLQTNLVTASAHLWKKVWNLDCIPKVNCFIWLLMHNKLLMENNITKRGIEGPSRCALCNVDLEIATHLFLHCKVAIQIWKAILHKVCVFFKPPDSLEQLLIV